jgi:uncharacterized protein (TIGR03000 family)
MYSVVLMVALTGGAETPAMGWGCSGCSSDCGCSGYSCNGCCGGYSCHGCRGGWGHKCSGCHGGGLFSGKGCCHGGGLFSGRGCCHGGGLFSHKGCHGCNGCCGGYGCHGCNGGYGCHGCNGGYGCHGCNGGYGCCGGGYGCNGGCAGCAGCYGGVGGTVVVPTEQKKAEPIKKAPIEEKKKKGETAAPAQIIVSLPADARLTVDGAATTSVSDRRIFQSPELAPGKNYSYTLRAEFTQDGKPVVVTKEVTIQAGAEVTVTMAAPAGVVSN